MRYVFGDYTLDLQRYTLHRAGQPIHLERLAFDVLVYLLQHRERVVSRQELNEALWSGAFVSDHALNRCISDVRGALADNVQTPRYIQTVRGRGYRFVGAVEEDALPPPVAPEGPLVSPPPAPTTIALSRRKVPKAFALMRVIIIGLALAVAVLTVVYGVVFWSNAWSPIEMPEVGQVPQDLRPPHEEPPQTPPAAVRPPAAEAPVAPVAQDQDPIPAASPPAEDPPAAPVAPA
jgi:DNA-binding winged helix-turn-helix (wHTH) protein